MRWLGLGLVLYAAASFGALTVDDYQKMQKKHGADNKAIELQVRMYLDGLLDGLFMASRDVPKEKQSWCIPENEAMTDELAFKLFNKELKLRKAEYAEFGELGIQIPFSLVMVDALQRAYPCK